MKNWTPSPKEEQARIERWVNSFDSCKCDKEYGHDKACPNKAIQDQIMKEQRAQS